MKKEIRNLVLGLIAIAAVIAFLVINYQKMSGEQNFQSNDTKQAKVSMGEYSVDEVAKHDKQDDCWLIIDGNVYDVTDFVKQHPGGIQMITSYCGKEATAAFRGQMKHGSGQTGRILEQLLIGVVKNNG